jgi:hypothetical protein|tara:strand:+ start:590 stop:850 length:261 start_codon:yes stop_codon:yes gene_type:complete
MTPTVTLTTVTDKADLYPGKTIRSYDFEGRDDCYIEGEVTSIGDDFVYFLRERVCWNGEVETVSPKEARTPLPGHLCFEWDRIWSW